MKNPSDARTMWFDRAMAASTRVPALAVAVAIAVSPALAAAQRRVLPPESEPRVRALVFDEGDAPLSIPIGGVRIEPSRVVVVLGDAEHPRAELALAAREAELDATRIGETPSFAVYRLSGDATREADAAARELLERVRARDDGSFWGTEAVTAASDDAHPELPSATWVDPLGAARRIASWVLLALLALALLVRARPPPRDVAIALALGVLAFLVRASVSGPSPLHANEHAIAELRGLAVGWAGGRHHEADLYGVAYPSSMRAILAALGLPTDAVFIVNAAFGALAVPALYAASRSLAPDRPGGATLAAGGLLLHPSHVMLSASESARAPALTLFAIGIALGLAARRAGTDRDAAIGWVAAALALCLAAELRVLTALLPFVGVALVLLAVPRGPATIPLPVHALALLLLAWTLATHGPDLARAAGAGADRAVAPLDIAMRTLGPRDALFDPSLTSFALLPLVLIGAVALVRASRARAALALGGATLTLLVPAMLVAACRTDYVRYQLDAHVPLLLLAGCAAPRRPSGWLRAVAPTAALALGLGSLVGLAALRYPSVHAQAYAIARRAPSDVDVVTGPVEMPLERRVRNEFPDYLLDDPSRARTEPRAGHPCVWWIGVACWSFARDEPAEHAVTIEGIGPMRAECVERLGTAGDATFAVYSLDALDVPERDGEFHDIVAEHPRVGFVRCR
ncbi:MAG: hypothetical protein AB7S26_17085 [Sandaracinaceae bacterium]